MKCLIIEDEIPAARQLQKLLKIHAPDIEILDVIDSVDASVSWLNTFPHPDLIFMDIQLADGLSFDIFKETTIQVPVIFTTAFDQYAIKAFKVNSIDYLLKPIQPEELEASLEKFKNFQKRLAPLRTDILQSVLEALSEKKYKERFLVKKGQQLFYVSVADTAYFFAEDGLVFLKTNDQKKFNVDFSLDQLQEILDPQYFFRINRGMICSLESIKKINTYFNSRLKLELFPKSEQEVIVSRDRVNGFKAWLDR